MPGQQLAQNDKRQKTKKARTESTYLPELNTTKWRAEEFFMDGQNTGISIS